MHQCWKNIEYDEQLSRYCEIRRKSTVEQDFARDARRSIFSTAAHASVSIEKTGKQFFWIFQCRNRPEPVHFERLK